MPVRSNTNEVIMLLILVSDVIQMLFYFSAVVVMTVKSGQDLNKPVVVLTELYD